MVKFPAVDVLSPPKSRTQTALSEAEVLCINAPLAVNVTVLKVRVLKLAKATVPLPFEGVVFVNVPPLAV
jgi:hypothetical protein